MNLADIITSLQANITALQSLTTPAPQFSQADVDAAKAAGYAQGMADEKAKVAEELKPVNTEVNA